MGSARFGMVANALSQGLGLFAGKKMDEERERLERKWKEELDAQRERNATARELRQYAHAETTQRESNRAADERVAESNRVRQKEGAANRTSRESEFNRTEVARAEEILYKRIDALRKDAASQLEGMAGMMDEGAEARINASFQNQRDEMVLGHVKNMMEKGAVGYDIQSPLELESKLIGLSMSPESATERTFELQDILWPTADNKVEAPAEPAWVADGKVDSTGQEIDQTTGELIPMGDPVTQPQAASIPVDMLGDTNTIPPAAGTVGGLRKSTGMTKYGSNPNYFDPIKSLFEETPRPPEDENPYALMGQRR